MRSTATIGPLTLTRDRSAAWSAPWLCAACKAPSPPFDPNNLHPLVVWVKDHAERCKERS